MVAAKTLGAFGADAKAAAPMLIGAQADSSVLVRNAAKAALTQIQGK